MTAVRERKGASRKDLCGLLGRSRQGYYKLLRREEREAIEVEIVMQEVVRIRQVQKRIGVRKIYHMITPYCREHAIKIGRDQLNEVMREARSSGASEKAEKAADDAYMLVETVSEPYP